MNIVMRVRTDSNPLMDSGDVEDSMELITLVTHMIWIIVLNCIIMETEQSI